MRAQSRTWILILLLGLLIVLSGCDQAQELAGQTEVDQISEIEEAEFYNALRGTVELVQAPVLFVGLVTLLGGWKLGRMGLAINGFVVGVLMLYTFLKTTDLIAIDDETTLRGLAVAGGILSAIAAFYLYNLMSLAIGGAIGTTILGGTWLQALDKVPPQLLVFLTTFISAMLMFLIFRLFLVGFSAVIGAALLMLAAPLSAAWVLPLAGLGILIQSGIAWWINDDIFRNMRGDVRQAATQAFGDVLGPFSTLRDKQREGVPTPADMMPSYSPFAQKRGAPAQAPHSPQGMQGGHPTQSPYHAPQGQMSYAQQRPQIPHPQQPPAYPAPVYTAPPPQPVAPVYQPPRNPAPMPQTPPANQAPRTPAYSPQPMAPANQAPMPQTPLNAPPPIVADQIPTAQAIPAQSEKTQPSMAMRMPNIALSDGRVIPLDKSQITVGRSSDCQIVVNDPEVSNHHLIFSVHSEGVTVLDNHSTNGSYINGQRMHTPHRLTPQDVIQIGAVTLRLVVE